MKFHLILFFFFSSRRRHTRSLCDWSSDVCSSDLASLLRRGKTSGLRPRYPLAMTSEARDEITRDEAYPHTTAGKIADLERRRSEAIHAGSERAVDKQHAKGKRTARERIDALLDPEIGRASC